MSLPKELSPQSKQVLGPSFTSVEQDLRLSPTPGVRVVTGAADRPRVTQPEEPSSPGGAHRPPQQSRCRLAPGWGRRSPSPAAPPPKRVSGHGLSTSSLRSSGAEREDTPAPALPLLGLPPGARGEPGGEAGSPAGGSRGHRGPAAAKAPPAAHKNGQHPGCLHRWQRTRSGFQLAGAAAANRREGGRQEKKPLPEFCSRSC